MADSLVELHLPGSSVIINTSIDIPFGTFYIESTFGVWVGALRDPQQEDFGLKFKEAPMWTSNKMLALYIALGLAAAAVGTSMRTTAG